MSAFRPTIPPPGRLVRLGVVLDARNPAERLVEIARMCDRAGIGAVWTDGWAMLDRLAAATGRVRLGVVLAGAGPVPSLPDALAGRLELTLPGATAADLAALRGGAGGGARPVVAVELAGTGATAGPGSWPAAADDVLLAAGTVEELALRANAALAAARAAGRDPATLGVAARLPVSVGRTTAEARARWEAEPAFAGLGPPDRAGIFGTLEQCHERVIALAHAGVTDLRCLLPNTLDVHDVIAQLTAMTVGTVATLAPGAPRSPAPPPPPGWGGRPRFPSGSAAPPAADHQAGDGELR
jgi:hypothetical protein